jgi:hypothetical protein
MATGGDAASKVQAPALALIIITAISLVLNLGLFFAAPAVANSVLQFFQSRVELPPGQQAPQVTRTIVDYFTDLMLGIIGGGFVIFGAIQMKNLQMWGVSLAACIVAMIPYLYSGPCCCLFGMPVGIWGLVVLLNQDVKAAFRS